MTAAGVGSNHRGVYRLARCYDVAFSFRNVEAECSTLASLVSRHGAKPAGSMLELAAGPGRHAREFARRGVLATALDSEPSMCEFAQERAQAAGLRLSTACADMVDFDLPQRFDLAVLLMDSASYMLDNDAVLAHLDCVAAHLVDGGLYVLEMSHPRDVFGVGKSTTSQWTSEAEGLRVDMHWGEPGDSFDPITQIDEVTVTVNWTSASDAGHVVERARQRRFTANEFAALVRASGSFDVVEWLGSLASPVPFDNDPAAWRMVPVLRKRAAAAVQRERSSN